ncbi:peptidase E [Paraburkholderia sp. UCT70]|uniref:Type 1 glutamine amidotransferase-like domain-containing protein n=1 Tax=Paraburkholderia sp. UCT70 TaxID=2991068 RepID=UPI003D236530
MRRILAIGGFSNGESEFLAATYIRDLTGKPNPRICLLSTPAADPPMLINDFDAIYGKLGCQTSNVTFYGVAGTHCVRADNAAAHLLQQDAIFVSGGNPRCALALWKEWGLDKVLRQAWESGVLLSGMSAGAICWFDHHVPSPANRNLPLPPGLGILPGNCDVHFHAGDGTRRKELLQTMRILAMPSAIAIDDDAAVLYEGDAIAAVLSWREGATAYQLEGHPDGVTERPLHAKAIGSLRYEPERRPISLSLAAKEACVGRFQLMSPMEVLITIEGEQLFAQYGSQPKHEIFPESVDRFFLKIIDAQVTFEKDRSGRVASLVHHQNGRDTRGVRLQDKDSNGL